MHGTTTVILTDTQLDFALGISDQIVVLDRGSIAFNGTPASFLSTLDKHKENLPLEGWASMQDEIRSLFSEPSKKGTRIKRALGIL